MTSHPESQQHEHPEPTLTCSCGWTIHKTVAELRAEVERDEIRAVTIVAIDSSPLPDESRDLLLPRTLQNSLAYQLATASSERRAAEERAEKAEREIDAAYAIVFEFGYVRDDGVWHWEACPGVPAIVTIYLPLHSSVGSDPVTQRTMRHVFNQCMRDHHDDCEEVFDGELHRGECVCQCHIVRAVRDYLHGEESRTGLEKILVRYADFERNENK